MKKSLLIVTVMLLMVSTLAMAAQPRTGAWLDSVVASVAEPGVAVSMIQAGVLDVFASGLVDPKMLEVIRADPALGYERLFGLFFELTLNPAGTPEEPVFRDGRLNPFAVPRIREAMNWLIDRDYVAEEISAGMAIPRYFPIHPAFPDYARLIAFARGLELYYAHNPARAEAVIAEEMAKLGAERIDGIWHVNGAPVEITLLIRIEDERRPIGEYVTRLLEGVGFSTRQVFGTAGELSPIWIEGDPYDGAWHVVTGGWIATVIDRDQADVFNFFYTDRGLPRPLWAATKPTPEFYDLADRLARGDFETLEEREAMFKRGLELAMADSHRIWLTNRIGIKPRRADVALAADLAGGISGSWLWALTTRFEDPATGAPVVGGTARVGMPNLLLEPWNPVAGTNWIFDMMFIRATRDTGALPDPFTGLWHPQRLERAEVYVREGLPVGVTHDWVDLQFVPPMEVPADAWVDWDAAEQRFITLAEAKAREGWDPARATAEVRVRVHYPADLFDTVKWHDGSPLSLGDFVMDMILGFDRAKEESPIFDPVEVPAFTTFMGHFRGVRIVSQEPLIIESYTNMTFLDAEVIAAGWTWFPDYAQGPGAWHNLALGVRAEGARELAFSTAQAGALGVEWMSFIAGPSLPILERHLGEATAAGFIPYAPTLAQFVTPEEVAARYAALRSWFATQGHFWIGTGPFHLHAAHPVERIVDLRRFADFPDPAEKWAGFVAPRIAEVEVSGPRIVRAGAEATFNIAVTFRDELYPVADVGFVTYLLLDAGGAIAHTGEAVAVQDGLWQAVLPAEKTAGLIPGSSRLEVVVSPLVVAIPTFDTATFVVLR